MIAKVNMYIHLKFGENFTMNMGDNMARSLFSLFLSLLLFFSLNPSISKTIKATGLKLCTQVGPIMQ